MIHNANIFANTLFFSLFLVFSFAMLYVVCHATVTLSSTIVSSGHDNLQTNTFSDKIWSSSLQRSIVTIMVMVLSQPSPCCGIPQMVLIHILP